MRNKRLFILISLVLVLSFLFIGCGKKSDVKNSEIEDENILDKDEKSIHEIGDNIEDAEDIEDIEDIGIATDSDANKNAADNKSQNEPVSNKAIKEENKNSNIGTQGKSSPSNIGEDKNPSVTIIIIGPEEVGTILDTTEVELNDEDTVFDILKQVVKDNNIKMEYKGKKSSIYIQGIDNIYEFDKGPESGWIFRVNGEISQSSSGTYKLNDGDKIEWLYTVEFGREFENKAGDK